MSKPSRDKQAIIEQLSRSGIVQISCEKTGVSRATYYRWRKDDSEFAKNCDQSLSDGAALINDLAESQLLSAIRDKNISAIQFWLRHHHRAYRAKLEVEANIHEQQELTLEQTELITQALRLAGMNVSEDNGNEQ
jgi:hypothetical protein